MVLVMFISFFFLRRKKKEMNQRKKNSLLLGREPSSMAFRFCPSTTRHPTQTVSDTIPFGDDISLCDKFIFSYKQRSCLEYL